MLYIETPTDTFTPWDLGPIAGIRHPRNIEQLWTDAELAAIGLFKAVETTIPVDMRSTGTDIQRVAGVVTKVHTLANITDHEKALTTELPRPAFLFIAEEDLGITEVDMEGFVALMSEVTPEEAKAKRKALKVLRNQQVFRRDNALLMSIIALSPLTDAQVDTAWIAGGELTW